jgi:hypothetical protein
MYTSAFKKMYRAYGTASAEETRASAAVAANGGHPSGTVHR